MGKREKFFIHGVEPCSKKEFEQMARDILYSSGEKYLNTKESIFMYNYWEKYHDSFYDKSGNKIARIGRRRNKYGKMEFFTDLEDGSRTDFSFILSSIYRVSRKAKVRQAMRKAIRYQVVKFANSFFEKHSNALCYFTNEPLLGNYHVDHVIPFHEISDNFIDSLGISYLTFPITDGTGKDEEGNSISNKSLLSDWQQFHEKIAVLRVVSPTANLSILRKSINSTL